MKRFAIYLLILGILVGVWLWWNADAGRDQAAYGWRPLPGGGEIRLRKLTYGTKHKLDGDETPWAERLQTAIRTRSWKPLTSRGASSSTGDIGRTNEPSVGIWIEGRNLSQKFFSLHDKSELTLPDGQTFYGSGGSGSGFPGTWTGHTYVPIVPCRAKMLHIAVTVNQQRYEFDVRNPAYRTDLPVWTPLPLPQTQQNGEVALTLRELALKSAHVGGRKGWRIQPTWTVTRNGMDAKRQFWIRASYEDAAGNVFRTIGLLSEPAWKVHATAARTGRYPFADNEVRWLGSFDKERVPADQNWTLFPDTNAAGFKLAGLFGAGQYDIKDGEVTLAGPPTKLDRTKESPTEWDHPAKIMHLRLEKAAFVTLRDSNDRVEVFQDDRGTPVEVDEEWSAEGPFGGLSIFELPEQAVRFGSGGETPIEFEFVVKPPELPDAKDAPGKR